MTLLQKETLHATKLHGQKTILFCKAFVWGILCFELCCRFTGERNSWGKFTSQGEEMKSLFPICSSLAELSEGSGWKGSMSGITLPQPFKATHQKSLLSLHTTNPSEEHTQGCSFTQGTSSGTAPRVVPPWILYSLTPSDQGEPLSPLQEPAQQKHLQRVISNKTKLAAVGLQILGP